MEHHKRKEHAGTVHEQPPTSVERSTTKVCGHDIVLAKYRDTRFYRLYCMLINPYHD